MAKDYVFCTKCGTKNPRSHKFCVKCGTRLTTGTSNAASASQTSSQSIQRPVSSSSSNKTPTFVWWIIGFVALIMVGGAGYRQYQKFERQHIRSYVYDELSKSDYNVKIDQDDQVVTIVPKSSSVKTALIYIATMYADGQAADDLDDSVKTISKKIDDKEGDGWTVALQNPENSKRFFWIYQDGKAKYRMQDHAVSYYDSDDSDDIGDGYDFDD